jgi:hypothetical protein
MGDMIWTLGPHGLQVRVVCRVPCACVRATAGAPSPLVLCCSTRFRTARRA